MKTLTVFTPTYNRKHTIHRTFESLCRQTCDDFEWLIIDDGSSDGTKEWVKSLGERLEVSGERLEFDWMGRVVDGLEVSGKRLEVSGKRLEVSGSDNYFKIIVDRSLTSNPSSLTSSSSNHSPLTITYIYKPNGGLYTGYNVAYQTILTELCVCIDSDDYMPDDAIEKILTLWKKHYPNGSLSSNLSTLTNIEYCGIVGLDYNVVDKLPIGGLFPCELESVYIPQIGQNKIHRGDTKMVFRTELMREVAPMIGFDGEKNFNPHYLAMIVGDKFPILVLNENLCWVEYQIGADSMSQGIYRQYVNSPMSFAKFRLAEYCLKHNTIKNKIRLMIHYNASCMIAKNRSWLAESPNKLLSLILSPISIIEVVIIKKKTCHGK